MADKFPLVAKLADADCARLFGTHAQSNKGASEQGDESGIGSSSLIERIEAGDIDGAKACIEKDKVHTCCMI